MIRRGLACILAVSVSTLLVSCEKSGGDAAGDSSPPVTAQPLLTADLSDWTYPEGSWEYRDGVLARTGKGDIWTRQQYGDFVLELDYKIEEKSNSGILFRCGDPEEWMQTALEAQIAQRGDGTQHGQCMGIYDCKSPDYIAPASVTISTPDGKSEEFPVAADKPYALGNGAKATIKKVYQNIGKIERQGRVVYYEGSAASGSNPALLVQIEPAGGEKIEVYAIAADGEATSDQGYRVRYQPVTWIEEKNVIKPAGEWNHVKLTAQGPQIKVDLNGREVLRMDVDQYTEAGWNPQGTANKYKIPVKDLPRKGSIGLQDHGMPVWFRNVTILPLD